MKYEVLAVLALFLVGIAGFASAGGNVTAGTNPADSFIVLDINSPDSNVTNDCSFAVAVGANKSDASAPGPYLNFSVPSIVGDSSSSYTCMYNTTAYEGVNGTTKRVRVTCGANENVYLPVTPVNITINAWVTNHTGSALIGPGGAVVGNGTCTWLLQARSKAAPGMAVQAQAAAVAEQSNQNTTILYVILVVAALFIASQYVGVDGGRVRRRR